MTRGLRFYQLTAIALGLGSSIGCGYLSLLSGDCSAVLVLRGMILDSRTGAAPTNAALGGRALSGGREDASITPLTRGGVPRVPPPAADGTFEIVFSTPFTACAVVPDQFPRPDVVEIIVDRGGCEQRFTIEINADTVIDPTAPDDVLELIDPILVPPCEP